MKADMDFDAPIDRHRWLGRLVKSAKGHARKARKPFELTTEFVETLCAEQRGRCAVTGLQFNHQRFPEALVKHPFATLAELARSHHVGKSTISRLTG
jgi:hypothetical protein